MSKFKAFMAIVACLVLLSSTGCMGRMALSGKVTKFNLEVTDNKWGREGVFLGMYIIPVYPTCALVDLFIINSIEFWTGENPISGETPLTEM